MRNRIIKVLFFFLLLCALPLPGNAEFSFVVTGDSRSKTDPTGINPIVKEIFRQISMENVDFTFYLGDLVSGKRDPDEHLKQLLCFKKMVSEFIPSNKFYPIIGNHEVYSMKHLDLFRSVFRNPQNGPVKYAGFTYFLAHKNCLFITLTTDFLGETGYVSDEQMGWLKEVLEKYRSVDHIFVMAHQPAYTAGYHVGFCLDAYPERRDALWKLLREYNVDAYFCAHEHCFLLRNFDGIYHIHTATAGSEFYPVSDGLFFHYALVKIDGEKVNLEIKDEKGVLRRQFFFFRRKEIKNVTQEEVMKYSNERILDEIEKGPFEVAWRAVVAAGKRKIHAASKPILNWTTKIIKSKSKKYFYGALGIRSLRLLNYKKALPQIKEWSQSSHSFIANEANYTLDSMEK